MSGPLRRIKRSRPADAGEPLPEDRAAETEGAAPTAETPPAVPETAGETATPGDATPAADPSAAQGAPAADASEFDARADDAGDTQVEAAADTTSDAPAVDPPDAKPRRRRWRPFRRTPKTAPPADATATPAAPVPVLLADPDTPAGLDPTDAPMRPPTGRRGRLRRRLRYLRRARELMLRDLGGLLYEVHRSGGGSVEAHATVIGAKVQRIAGLDAEAHALEAALAAPRGEAIVFEPGVGGTCATCGELYGSDARFCANCGAATGAAAPAAEATPATVVPERTRRAFWRRAARSSAPTSPDESADSTPAEGEHESAPAGGDAAPRAGDDETTAIIAPGEPEPDGDEPRPAAWGETPPAEPASDERAADEPPPAAGTQNPGAEPGPGEPRNPFSGARNGRPEDHTPPDLSSGDPLASRESRK